MNFSGRELGAGEPRKAGTAPRGAFATTTGAERRWRIRLFTFGRLPNTIGDDRILHRVDYGVYSWLAVARRSALADKDNALEFFAYLSFCCLASVWLFPEKRYSLASVLSSNLTTASYQVTTSNSQLSFLECASMRSRPLGLNSPPPLLNSRWLFH